jgi:hypothetical protein
MTLPEIVWEASFGIYLTFKGFKTPHPIETSHAVPVPAFA